MRRIRPCGARRRSALQGASHFAKRDHLPAPDPHRPKPQGPGAERGRYRQDSDSTLHLRRQLKPLLDRRHPVTAAISTTTPTGSRHRRLAAATSTTHTATSPGLPPRAPPLSTTDGTTPLRSSRTRLPRPLRRLAPPRGGGRLILSMTANGTNKWYRPDALFGSLGQAAWHLFALNLQAVMNTGVCR